MYNKNQSNYEYALRAALILCKEGPKTGPEFRVEISLG